LSPQPVGAIVTPTVAATIAPCKRPIGLKVNALDIQISKYVLYSTPEIRFMALLILLVIVIQQCCRYTRLWFKNLKNLKVYNLYLKVIKCLRILEVRHLLRIPRRVTGMLSRHNVHV